MLTNSDIAVSYAHDALGRRAATTTAEGTVRHVYDGIHCIADTDESGTILRSYIWGPGIDNLLSVAIADGDGLVQTYYALTDHQNTVHGFADTNGTVVVHYAYDAWGNLLSEECSVPALASNRYRFQGREWSAATGLTNFRARWYDPETGRWLSKDPIGLAGGLNLYAFCGDDSVNFLDTDGMQLMLASPGPIIALGVRPAPIIHFALEKQPITSNPHIPSPPRVLPPEPLYSTPKPSLPQGWRPGNPIPEGFRPPPNPKANWYNPRTGESLHDDMTHPPPTPPHWDYIDPSGAKWCIPVDRPWIPKPSRMVPVPNPSPTVPISGSKPPLMA